MTSRIRPRSGGFHRGDSVSGGGSATNRTNTPRQPIPRSLGTARTSFGDIEGEGAVPGTMQPEPDEVAVRAAINLPPHRGERVEYVPASERKNRQAPPPPDDKPNPYDDVDLPPAPKVSGFEAKFNREKEEDDDGATANVGNCLDDFQVVEELGRGAFGSVSKVVSKRNQRTYALKKIEVVHLKPKHQTDALSEVSILRSVRHPNIIRYFNSFMEHNILYIVMEYAPGGDLQKLIQRQRKQRKYIRESILWRFMWEIGQALRYLHEHKIIHRDLKSLNVFLTADQKIKIGDLGVSRIINDDEMMAQTRVGTPLYLAPELIKRQPYDFKVDVWSLGCLMYQLCALKPPFEGDNIYALAVEIMNQTPRILPGHYSSDMCAIIFRMLEKKAKDRPYMNSVINTLPSSLAAGFRAGGAAADDGLGLEEVAVAEKRPVARPASASRAGPSTHGGGARPVEPPLSAAAGPVPATVVPRAVPAGTSATQRPSSARPRRASDMGPGAGGGPVPSRYDVSAPLQISVKQYAPSDHFSQSSSRRDRAASMPEHVQPRTAEVARLTTGSPNVQVGRSPRR